MPAYPETKSSLLADISHLMPQPTPVERASPRGTARHAGVAEQRTNAVQLTITVLLGVAAGGVAVTGRLTWWKGASGECRGLGGKAVRPVIEQRTMRGGRELDVVRLDPHGGGRETDQGGQGSADGHSQLH